MRRQLGAKFGQPEAPETDYLLENWMENDEGLMWIGFLTGECSMEKMMGDEHMWMKNPNPIVENFRWDMMRDENVDEEPDPCFITHKIHQIILFLVGYIIS